MSPSIPRSRMRYCSACSMTTAKRPSCHCPGWTPGSGTASSTASNPASCTGFGSSGPIEPAAGQRCNPAKLLIDPYARAISGEVDFGPSVYGHDIGNPEQPSELDSADAMPRSVMVAPLAVGRTGFGRGADRRVDPARPASGGFGHLRGPRQRLHRTAPGHSRRIARYLCRAGAPGGDRPPAPVGHHRGRVAAGPPQRSGGISGRARADELLGLQHRRLLRAARRLFRSGPGRPAGRPGRRVPGHGAGAACRGHRGHPGCRLQPHL